MPKALLHLANAEKGLEFHVFALPKLVRHELSLVIPDVVLAEDSLLILSLFRTHRELCAPSQLVNEEKDRVLSQVSPFVFPPSPFSSQWLSSPPL